MGIVSLLAITVLLIYVFIIQYNFYSRIECYISFLISYVYGLYGPREKNDLFYRNNNIKYINTHFFK